MTEIERTLLSKVPPYFLEGKTKMACQLPGLWEDEKKRLASWQVRASKKLRTLSQSILPDSQASINQPLRQPYQLLHLLRKIITHSK